MRVNGSFQRIYASFRVVAYHVSEYGTEWHYSWNPEIELVNRIVEYVQAAQAHEPSAAVENNSKL